jgi:hypothetical protein
MAGKSNDSIFDRLKFYLLVLRKISEASVVLFVASIFYVIYVFCFLLPKVWKKDKVNVGESA